MKEIIIALASSSITILITSFFSYHFQLMREVRNESVKYKSEILKKVYTPIIKILITMRWRTNEKIHYFYNHIYSCNCP